jgi:D-aspartate ligase
MVPAIVLGEGITVLGTIRSLGAAGIETYCIGRSSVDEKYSRWYKKLYDLDDAQVKSANLSGLLEALPFEKAVLIPCSDHWTVQVAKLPASLAMRFPSSQSTLAVQEILVDKGAFRELLAENGVPAPITYLNKEQVRTIAMQGKHARKFFIKPRDSQSFCMRFGVKALWAASTTECIEKLEELEKQGFEMVVQEYIPGGPDHHMYVEGFRDQHGEIRALFARQRLRMNPRDFGNSTIMVSVPLSQAQQASDDLVRLLKAVNYRGIFSAEFKYDDQDSLFKLIEINARPWWYIECPTLCGVNVAAMAYLDALGQPVPEVKAYQSGRMFMNFLADFNLWRECYRNKEIKFNDWWLEWAQSNATVFRWTDPLPGIMWCYHRALKRLAGK